MVCLIAVNGSYKEVKVNVEPELLAHRIKVSLQRGTRSPRPTFVMRLLAAIPVPLFLFPCSISRQTARTSHPRVSRLPCPDLHFAKTFKPEVKGAQEAEVPQLGDELSAARSQL